MSLQWSLISWFVYAEVAVVLVICLPLLSVQRWRRILRSRLLRKLDAYGNVYFNVFLGLLGILLLDALRKLRQYSREAEAGDELGNPHGFALGRLRKFRAQSNLTLAGGALLLWLVLRWMMASLVARAFAEEDLAAERLEVSKLRGQLEAARVEADRLARLAADADEAGAVADGGDARVDKKQD